VIPAGYDFFSTDEANVDLTGLVPGVGIVPMTGFPWPTNDPPFFALPPDQSITDALFRITWINQHGNVTSPHSEHAVTQIRTVIWGETPFDTIVRRNADVDISGLGAQVDVPIEMVWLSLRSINPVSIFGFDFFVHVGLSATQPQTVGRMRLTSEKPSGSRGTADIGRVGDTDDTSDSAFLGLPVTFQAIFVPVGGGPVVQGPEGMIVLHGACPAGQNQCLELGPSGVYSVPEPGAILLFTFGVGAAFVRARHRHRVETSRHAGIAPSITMRN
jgi:hypothetical protein